MIILEKISAWCSFWRKFGFSPNIKTGLNIQDQIGYLLRSFFKDLIGIDHSIFKMMLIRIFHDDYCATWLYLVEFEAVTIVLVELNIFKEESDIMFTKLSMFVFKFLFD